VDAIKTFNIRIPKKMWVYLKHESIKQEKTMNVIIVSCLEELMKKKDKKLLTEEKSVVS